jgi:nucleotide-binding universal stress UspA family protein
MKDQKTILVPTDFSEVCAGAVNYGAQIAQLLNYSLTIVHVIDRKTQAQLKKEGLTENVIMKRLEGICSRISKKLTIPVQCITRKGSIFSTIGQLAEETNAGLMILGTHGMTGIQQKISGSYAKKVVTSSPCPVIVIQKGVNFKGYKNIVFPVSTTAEVRQKVAWAAFIAKIFKSKIHIFQLFEPAEESQKKMKLINKQITTEFDKRKLSYTFVQAEKGSNFGEQVIAYTKKNKADLLTIMTNPSSLNFIFNRYTERMIFNEHKIPVMCVNPVDTWEEIWKF